MTHRCPKCSYLRLSCDAEHDAGASHVPGRFCRIHPDSRMVREDFCRAVVQAWETSTPKWAKESARAGGDVSPAGRGVMLGLGALYSLLSIAGAATGAYHGYKRTGSAGWSILWFMLGGTFPIASIPISIAQGFGRPKE